MCSYSHKSIGYSLLHKKGALCMLKRTFLLPFMAIFILASCSAGESKESTLDYEQTKKMIVDILKTDEGKKAIQDLMSDEEIKQKLIMNQDIVKETIQQTLTSEKGTEFWKKMYEDPKFAESVAKSMKSENEALLKDLMKDPEYQGMLIDIFHDPELQKDIAKALKSKEFREHLQKVMTETFESPLYKAKIQDLLLKAAEEMGSGGGGSQGKSEEEGKSEDSGSKEEGGGEEPK